MPLALRLTLAVVGALIYATAGFLLGSQNADWFEVADETNDLLPPLGVGAALVVAGFWGSPFNERLGGSGAIGKAGQIMVVAGSAMFVIAWIIDFAIFGTLSLGLGLVLIAVAVTKDKLVSLPDRLLFILAAVGSLTWNTETVSAFLLVGVGLIWMVLAFRLLPGEAGTEPIPKKP